ncbi:hypothetical protein [Spirochaeta cellobiosiphila]|uniref:hypothetical protein n=1 Tax=Spirochaeta cellobiosiphila TaxID=504483 RepID=UPI000425A07A|nr:hypothetical protein [Spirochaeta cellobiosiphila]
MDQEDLYFDSTGYLSYDIGDNTVHFIFGGGYVTDDILFTKKSTEFGRKDILEEIWDTDNKEVNSEYSYETFTKPTKITNLSRLLSTFR